MLITLSSLLLCSVIGVAAVYAETAATPTVTLEVPIGEVAHVVGLSQYIQVFYKFAVSAVAVIAGVMIMYSGVMWLSAAGSSQRIGEAKERIIAAISGLILATVSYVLLNTINPALVRLTEPSIIAAEVPASVSQAATGSDSATTSVADTSCPGSSDVVDIGDTMVQYSSHAASLYESNHGGSGLIKPELVEPLSKAFLSAETHGMELYVNSDYRTYAKQQELWNCYQDCSSSCTSCNQAAEPDCSAPHQTGKALDLTWYPIGNKTGVSPQYTLYGYANGTCNGGGYHPRGTAKSAAQRCSSFSSSTKTAMNNSETALQNIMKTIGFKRICIEWWHFEYNGPSSSVCEPGKY